MNSYLKVGIAGYGLVGKIRKKILDKIPGVRVVAISEKNQKNRVLSKGIKFFDNYKKLFNEDLDIIFVSLPNKYAADATPLPCCPPICLRVSGGGGLPAAAWTQRLSVEIILC